MACIASITVYCHDERMQANGCGSSGDPLFMSIVSIYHAGDAHAVANTVTVVSADTALHCSFELPGWVSRARQRWPVHNVSAQGDTHKQHYTLTWQHLEEFWYSS